VECGGDGEKGRERERERARCAVVVEVGEHFAASLLPKNERDIEKEKTVEAWLYILVRRRSLCVCGVYFCV